MRIITLGLELLASERIIDRNSSENAQSTLIFDCVNNAGCSRRANATPTDIASKRTRETIFILLDRLKPHSKLRFTKSNVLKKISLYSSAC